jgi:glycerophosphoryl diester phosphodiesterase
MNEPLTVSALARLAWGDLWRARRALFVFESLFKLIEAWLLVPSVAVVLAAILSRAGHVAVSNLDILAFLRTPAGLLYAAFFATIAVALLLFEQAGIMVLAARAGAVERPPISQAIRAAFRNSLGIVQLGAVTATILALTFVPFVLVAVLTYGLLLTGHDFYFYLTERPPVFWLAASIGALLLLGALAAGLWLCVRWAFALSILLFEGQSWRAALRASRDRVRGLGWRIGFLLGGWLLASMLLGLALEACFRFLAAAVLARGGERPIALLVLLLLAQCTLLASWSFVTVVGYGLLTRRLYLWRSEQLGLLDEGKTARAAEQPIPPWNWRLAVLALMIFLLSPLVLWTDLSRYTAARPVVRVTAHRGHARAAPENTLAAIRKAIKSGADYVEVDVQQTADGAVVLLHDRDLKRVAGDSRRLEDITFDEVRKLDVGSWFGPEFAGERVPTLEEAIQLCRGQIRMNIELKDFGHARRLAKEVARIVREQDFEADCLITSFDYDALGKAKQLNPGLRTGLIVAHALGDVSRLQVDALSVRADFLSDGLLRAAHRAGQEVHVWGLREAREMARMIKRGADNLIVADPDLAIRVRDEWANLTETERLLLASRLLLGLEP